MSLSELHVVLGASGGAGNAIVRALHGANRPVRAVNRTGHPDVPEGVETVRADLGRADDVAGALRGASVVYMAAQPPYHRWPDEFPPMLHGVLSATAAGGAKLVMVDNLYGYGPGAGTMGALSPEKATDAKGAVRRRMTEELIEAHERGRVPVTVGRASDYFGPRSDNSAVTALAIRPVADSKTLRWPGHLDVLHSVAYLPDIARAYVALGTEERADGRIWILPHPPPVTGRQFLDKVNDALPTPLKTATLSTSMLRLAAPFHRVSKEMLAISYQWTEPFVVDDSDFRDEFGPFETTPLEEAIHTTVEWYRSQGGS